MKNIRHLNASNEVYNMVTKFLRVHPTKPYTFILTNDSQFGLHVHTEGRFEKIKKWSEKNGAEVNWTGERWAANYEIEITDPVAAAIEFVLQEIQ